MAGKNVEGQLELFSLFDSVEELEQKIKGAGLKEVQGEPVMEQCYRHRDTGETAVAAYLDYNRVYVADWGRKPLLYQFDSTKEAVGYYADWLDRHASDEAAAAVVTAVRRITLINRPLCSVLLLDRLLGSIISLCGLYFQSPGKLLCFCLRNHLRQFTA